MKVKQKEEIFYNIINSLLAGSIAFLSSVLTIITITEINLKKIIIALAIALITSALIALQKFYDYWKGEEKQYLNFF